MTDLVSFLSARLESDWAWAETVLDEPNMAELHGIARRWLREVEFKRRVLARYQETFSGRKAHRDDLALAGALLALAGVLNDLATAYSDHPDYDPAIDRTSARPLT